MLDNINVLGYQDCFMARGQLHIVTDFCEEGDLFTQIRARKDGGQMYSENEAMNAFIQLANGLNHIHSKRILHRDLKTQVRTCYDPTVRSLLQLSQGWKGWKGRTVACPIARSTLALKPTFAERFHCSRGCAQAGRPWHRAHPRGDTRHGQHRDR